MSPDFEICKNIRDQEDLRQSFSALSKATFGLDFEPWYLNGYWSDHYVPYAMVIEGKVVSNVSANIMTFDMDGVSKTFIQIGTVMTDEAHRGRGFSKLLMQEVEKDYKDIADGFYLFANDSVVDFYPKFGYTRADEYTFSISSKSGIPDRPPENRTVEPLDMGNPEHLTRTIRAIRESIVQSALDLRNNEGLVLFYLTQFMRENVYYLSSEDAYVVAEEEDTLFIHHIFSRKHCDLNAIIAAFGSKFQSVELGFAPLEKDSFCRAVSEEENTTLFVKGVAFDHFDKLQLRFPTLSRA